MKFSKLGLALVIVFLAITLIMSLYLELTYQDGQWMWGFILGGYPVSLFGFNVFKPSGIGYIFGGYILNGTILYATGHFIGNLVKK